MTPQEAIQVLCNNVTVFGRSVGKSRYYKAMQMGVDALEKQIPIRVIEYRKGGYSCRFCKSVIYPKSPYCIHCGQALDWSDTE